MSTKPRIYLDHAATSWPKSAAVTAAITDYLNTCGVAAGRGAYAAAHTADRIVTDCREQLAAKLDAPSRHCISLHTSGTMALNAAIHGLVPPGAHVVTTAAEHNSVLRPLEFLRQTANVEITIVNCDTHGNVTADDVLAAVRPTTFMAVVGHVSNVTGAIKPLAQIGDQLRNTNTLVMCDAAQSFGYLPISVNDLGIDVLAIPGHKGGGGPLGTGALYLAPALHEVIRPLIQGGTGSQSESLAMPEQYPAKLEAGSINLPGCAGWLAALKSWDSAALTGTTARMLELSFQLHRRLESIERLRVIGTSESLPVVSVVLDDYSPIDAAMILDSEYGIETRAGWHCSALIHQYLRTTDHGTLRISAGPQTTEFELDTVARALQEIVATG